MQALTSLFFAVATFLLGVIALQAVNGLTLDPATASWLPPAIVVAIVLAELVFIGALVIEASRSDPRD